MTDKSPDEYAVQASPYIGNVMVNVRGNTFADFRQNLSDVAEHIAEISDNLCTIAGVGVANAVLGHGATAPEVTPSAAPQGATQAAPAPPSTPSPGNGPSCAHGPRKWKTGITKSGRNAGKEWRGWACGGVNLSREQECNMEWVND